MRSLINSKNRSSRIHTSVPASSYFTTGLLPAHHLVSGTNANCLPTILVAPAALTAYGAWEPVIATEPRPELV